MNEKLQDPSGSVSGGDLPSIPMNSDKQPQTEQVPVWATLLILIVGTIAGALIVHWLDGPPTEKELLQQELERIKRQ